MPYDPTSTTYFTNNIESCAELLHMCESNVVHVYAPFPYKTLDLISDVGGSLSHFTFHCTRRPNQCAPFFKSVYGAYDRFFSIMTDIAPHDIELFMTHVKLPTDWYRKRILKCVMYEYGLYHEYHSFL